MGLDISAYRNIKLISAEYSEDREDEGAVRVYPNPDFLDHADGLVDGYYSGECLVSFRAGSYSGYNRWRELLCDMICGARPEVVWAGRVVPPAFLELIHFSDCEGAIGPRTSAKLAKDFADHEDRAAAYAPLGVSGENFLCLYREWREAFEAGAQDGVVTFH